ncbi:MAG: JAB domain-containing protein, partial [Luteibaculum sp.]
LFEDLSHEEFYLLLLNRSNRVTEKLRLSVGGVTGTVVDMRLLVKPALLALASGVILAHNHPSGNLRPSEADRRLTQKAKEALKLFDIQLMDHLIITKEGYTSFADEGWL